MKKILILGANSYIGTSFRKYLTTEYPEQYIVDTGSLRGDAWRRMDWSGYESILNVTGKAHADISSLTEEQKQEYYAVNCDLAREAAEKAIADGAKQYIYLSSIIVYGDSSNSKKPVHITAKTNPAPSNFYGDSKWQAEQKLQELFAQKQTADTRLAILRLPMIYGPGCKGNYRTLQKMAQKLPLFPTYHNERSVLQKGYCQHALRPGRWRETGERHKAIQFSSLDYQGVAEVVDPEALRKALFEGVGHAKSFGCGLLLVRPLC